MWPLFFNGEIQEAGSAGDNEGTRDRSEGKPLCSSFISLFQVLPVEIGHLKEDY